MEFMGGFQVFDFLDEFADPEGKGKGRGDGEGKGKGKKGGDRSRTPGRSASGKGAAGRRAATPGAPTARVVREPPQPRPAASPRPRGLVVADARAMTPERKARTEAAAVRAAAVAAASAPAGAPAAGGGVGGLGAAQPPARQAHPVPGAVPLAGARKRERSRGPHQAAPGDPHREHPVGCTLVPCDICAQSIQD